MKIVQNSQILMIHLGNTLVVVIVSYHIIVDVRNTDEKSGLQPSKVTCVVHFGFRFRMHKRIIEFNVYKIKKT